MSEEAETKEDEPTEETTEETNEDELSVQYRGQRDAALRKIHAYEAILRHHGIDTSQVTPEATASLVVNNGVVDGAFDYRPPEPRKKEPPPSTKTETQVEGMKKEDIAKMTPQQINENWDAVQKVLAQ